MKIWERHGLLTLPYHVLAASMRRGVEIARLHYWRYCYGWDIEQGVRVHLSVHLPRKMTVSLKKGAVIGQSTIVIAEKPGGTLTLGEGCNVAQRCTLDVTGRLTLGQRATISEGSVLYTHSHGRDPKSAPKAYALEVGAGAWICTRAVVLASTQTVGDGAIVGPCQVVRRPVPARALVAED